MTQLIIPKSMIWQLLSAINGSQLNVLSCLTGREYARCITIYAIIGMLLHNLIRVRLNSGYSHKNFKQERCVYADLQ